MLLTALPHRLLDSPSAPRADVTATVSAILQIHLAKGPAELLERLHEAVMAIGASAGVYAAVIPESDGEHSTFTLYACDPRFATEQASLGPIEQHPWLRYAQDHTLPATDGQVSVQNPMDEAAMRLAARFGFNAHLVVPTGHGFRLQRVEMLSVEGQLFTRTWWTMAGDSVTEYSAAAKARLGSWDTRFDDDYARWLASLPAPAPTPPVESGS